MVHAFASLLGLLILYAPIVLVGLVIGMAMLVRLAPLWNARAQRTRTAG